MRAFRYIKQISYQETCSNIIDCNYTARKRNDTINTNLVQCKLAYFKNTQETYHCMPYILGYLTNKFDIRQPAFLVSSLVQFQRYCNS